MENPKKHIRAPLISPRGGTFVQILVNFDIHFYLNYLFRQRSRKNAGFFY